jgi:hypothetical protein
MPGKGTRGRRMKKKLPADTVADPQKRVKYCDVVS